MHSIFVSQEQQSDIFDQVFRIYKDVRFSKDKTPYKTHFAIAFHRTKPKYRGGFYIHIQPGNTFVASGFWNPNKDDLFRIRKEIESDGDYFRGVIENKKILGFYAKNHLANDGVHYEEEIEEETSSSGRGGVTRN